MPAGGARLSRRAVIRMHAFARRLFAWSALIAFVLGTNLHLPVVQALGWARMTADYARVMAFEDALETAVSGRELCGFCAYVRRAEHTKRATEALLTKSLRGSHLIAASETVTGIRLCFADQRRDYGRPDNRFAHARRTRPATPPPRFAA